MAEGPRITFGPTVDHFDPKSYLGQWVAASDISHLDETLIFGGFCRNTQSHAYFLCRFYKWHNAPAFQEMISNA